MDLLIHLLPHSLPKFSREEMLDELFAVTADAFRCAQPVVEGLSYEDHLRAYALFTRDQAESALRNTRSIHAVKTRLYRKAYPLGAKIREWLSLDSMEEVMAIGQLLYRVIGVEIDGDMQGNVIVRRCYFSQFYSAPVCELISALDDGVFSGLSGGGRLTFSERMTGGRPCCKAKLRPREEALR